MIRSPAELLRLKTLHEISEGAAPTRPGQGLPSMPLWIDPEAHPRIAERMTHPQAAQAFDQGRNVAQPIEPGRNFDITG
jgi:hypothetical protein